MIHYITHINDFLGNNYLGVKITGIQTFLEEFKEILGENDYDEYTKYQQERDHNSHHITIINVMEYNMLCKGIGMDKFVNSLDKVFKYGIDDLKMMGIGTAAKNENRAYFIVCKSDKLDAVRTRYGLEQRDLHITLGFKYKDVFGVRKNEVMKKNGRFLKLLSQEFYNNENWNFIRKIGNFDLDIKADLIPVALDKSKIKFKCDGYFIDISYLEDGEKFWVATKYPINKDLPRLPEAEIKKILKLN
jgi:hypothetical protein